MQTTQDLYNTSASRWRRDQPLLLSDFTARPRVLEVLAPVQGLELWDLGCGEGSMARSLVIRPNGRKGPARELWPSFS
jgi:hypothetical protein